MTFYRLYFSDGTNRVMDDKQFSDYALSASGIHISKVDVLGRNKEPVELSPNCWDWHQKKKRWM